MQNYYFTPRVIFSEKHDVLFLYTYAMTYYFCCTGHGFILMEEPFWQPHCNLVTLPHIYICSGGLATISVSGDFVTISGSLAVISVVCSGWVGQ